MHISIMKNEILEAMNIKPAHLYIDATFGEGGHSRSILEKGGIVLAIDRDFETKKYADILKKDFPNHFFWVHSSFCDIKKIWHENAFPMKADGILFDLGFSSNQIDDPERGFSFKHDFFDMRFDRSQEVDAKVWINNVDEKEMQNAFFEYAEEYNAKKIASDIVKLRKTDEIVNAQQIVNICKKYASFNQKTHCATKVFQAIRIAVNNEFENIKLALNDCFEILNEMGVIAVLSFHSLEDKIIKEFFKNHVNFLQIPTEKEVKENLRARSAKLRYVYKKS